MHGGGELVKEESGEEDEEGGRGDDAPIVHFSWSVGALENGSGYDDGDSDGWAGFPEGNGDSDAI
jgi:hypothetical protein